MTKAMQGTAKVKLTVEIKTGAWGSDCTLGQLQKQAAESGISRIRHIIAGSNAKIIGEPEVIAVLGKP